MNALQKLAWCFALVEQAHVDHWAQVTTLKVDHRREIREVSTKK